MEAHQLRVTEHEEITLGKNETPRQGDEEGERQTKHERKKKLPTYNGDNGSAEDGDGFAWRGRWEESGDDVSIFSSALVRDRAGERKIEEVEKGGEDE
ncbi:hypothetical protein QL285_081188 [Trifolium repens]|jgi:hypothetical protein|nr:hypothetical protein QL285_081188 [Trifolium repens]